MPISPMRKGEPALTIYFKVSKTQHITRRVDGENLIYVRRNRFKIKKHTLREIPIPKCKSKYSQETITLKLQVPIGIIPGIHRTSLEYLS